MQQNAVSTTSPPPRKSRLETSAGYANETDKIMYSMQTIAVLVLIVVVLKNCTTDKKVKIRKPPYILAVILTVAIGYIVMLI